MPTEQTKTAVLVEPQSEQQQDLEKKLPDWQFVNVPASRVSSEPHTVEPTSPDVIMIFSRTHEEEDALALSKTIREESAYDDIPLLVAITIYQMPLGHDVEKLPKTEFIFRPIDADDLNQQLARLQEE